MQLFARCCFVRMATKSLERTGDRMGIERRVELATCNNENTSATILFFHVTTDQAREQLQFHGLNDGEGPLDLRGQSCLIYMAEKSF
ncbi:hypothetical protein D5086_016689 [Populus alba]|uniref:Uncharacterized protein n=1 Tax=Populus alba TaxID=43335 RepID=A0ACC4BUW7_POPAL